MTLLSDIVARRAPAMPIGNEVVAELRRQASSARATCSLGNTLRQAGKISFIAEYKRRSPSAGAIRPPEAIEPVVCGYVAAGARALSILTESNYFAGSIGDLARVRQATAVPLLRKDFLNSEYDILQARVAGADAVLLIVRILSPELLSALLHLTHELNMEALVETHTPAEIDIALAAGAKIIGFNHRDLDTLAIDLRRSEQVRQLTGPDVVLVAESGLRTTDDIKRVHAAGFDAVLIGESLLKTQDPGKSLATLIGSLP